MLRFKPKYKPDPPLGLLASPPSRGAKSFRSFFRFPLWRGMGSVLAICFVLWAGGIEAASPRKLPQLDDVMAYVDRHFANTTDYRPGDIISTSNVMPLLEGLDRIGWKVPNGKSLMKRVSSDNDYVVKQLRTDPGRKFMQQICNLPLGYDRLFHLSRIPLGRQQVHKLIRTKDGYKMIEYMTTTQMGKNFGKQLSNSPRGTDFNKPTGDIYTAVALKAELEKSYAITLQMLAKANR
jgi:hypothetical protein